MIFGTMKERQEVLDTIAARKEFEDLTDIQMACIHGMYWALDAVEQCEANAMYDEGSILEKMIHEIDKDAWDDASLAITLEIMETVAGFRDSNYSEGDDQNVVLAEE